MISKITNLKKTTVAWMPEIPADWDLKRGKFLFKSRKVINEKMQCKERLGLTLNGVIDRFEGDGVGLNPNDLRTYQVFEEDELVFKLIDLENKNTSRVGYVHKRGIMSSAYIRVLNNPNVNMRYFYYQYFNLYQRFVFNMIGQGVRATMSSTDLLNIPVAIPPLSIQNSIVAYLDKKNNEIDKFIRNKERLIELLKLEKDTITKQLVTRGIDEYVSFKKTDIYWIKEIPSHWDIKPFKVAFNENKRRNDFKEDYPVLSLSYGNVIFKDHDSNMGLVPMNYDSYQIINPDMLVFRFTDLQNDHKSLRVGLAKNKGIITSAYLAVIKQSKIKLSMDYAYLLLHSYDIDKVFYQFGGGVRQAIGFPDVKQLPILLPPIEEQNKIVDEQIKQTNKINNLISKAEQELSSIKEYREALITDLVTGKRSVPQLQKN